MKRRPTTSLSQVSFTKRVTLIVVAWAVAITVPIAVVAPAKADQFDERIRQLQAEINGYQQKAGALRDQANTLQAAVDGLNSQIAIIQAQIDLSQAKYDKLVADIKLNEQKIAFNKELLGKTIAEIYVDDKISPLEMLASSKNISEYVDKQEYRSSARDTLTTAIDDIKQLKKELEIQRVDVQRVLADQQNARRELDVKRGEQQSILNQTRGEEAAYQQLTARTEAQKLEVMRQQQAAIEAAMRRNGGMANILPGDPNKGGYPWEDGCWVGSDAMSRGGPNGNGTDELGYGCRQCVSYTAWKVYQRTGYKPLYWGNANMWPGSARNAGFGNQGSTPRVNSVGVISAGTYGHVVWVEAVNGDGTIDISQYNYWNAGGPGWGHYSRMRVSASTYDTYIYF